MAGIISGLLSKDDIWLWRRWVGRRTVLQLGVSPVMGTDSQLIPENLYSGMKIRNIPVRRRKATVVQ
ncbi:MAG: hypothetical protein AUK47_01585 [Deltaproteobacteria bacterium CG2_30_63_29]|nr:MAG: hypothetical protein AUK47_01585 [Deltaproteobacteria bacterium CG2_30_63_29]PIV98044.1 MAG: hypothetical protein COW42_16920 [Deltaproteobacteria bacterium CG17_big_fil_post_rev_8_21_14_2_50_63_7]PJB44377.1 MAG: hypothetical protein CO108_08820 [Deltaproteobacteria bacterium CG_4_9_14_3_um_filter_63_12]